MNAFILRNIKDVELVGVGMRITSFTIVSWLGPDSPFLPIWLFNSLDAIILSWCAVLRKDLAYTLLNCFWIAVGIVGVLRSLQVI